jgi:enamine deaminase RidA (YjgF/YER057c/UK114 family)
VPAVGAGTRLFVAGHDPERGGQLVYRGRIGGSVSVTDARAALCLATANALASARAAVGSLERLRCVVLAGFVSSAGPEGLAPELLTDSLALVATALPAGTPPAVWLRPVQGLAGGMPVEVELVLETRPRRAREPLTRRRRTRARRRGGAAPARAPRRSAGRTS